MTIVEFLKLKSSLGHEVTLKCIELHPDAFNQLRDEVLAMPLIHTLSAMVVSDRMLLAGVDVQRGAR